MKSAYVGCTNARSMPATASVIATGQFGSRTNRKYSAITAGTSSCRAVVPGSSSDVYAPPPPGASAIIATCASIVPTASQRRAEDLAPHLVREHEGKRGEDARLVQDDRARVDGGELRHERKPAVPERERVARVQPSVLELVDRPKRESAEVVELAHAPEVEERVALDDPLDAPTGRCRGRCPRARRLRDPLGPSR